MSREMTLEAFKQWQDLCFARVKEQNSDPILRGEHFELGELPADGIFPMMADDFTRELRNTVNRFYIHIFNGDCWFQIARTYPQPKRASLMYEFADSHLELALSKPYALKSHFVHAATHILHRSNRHVDQGWVDELPHDRQIKMETLIVKGQFWKGFPRFKDALDQLDTMAYRDSTMNFRNRFNHQFELNIDRGLYPFFERRKENGSVVHEYKVAPPLNVEKILPILYEQHSVARSAYESFFALVLEQSAAWPRK